MTAKKLHVVRTVKGLRAQVAKWRKDDLTVGLIPTMGALHDGHMALVRAALAKCDRVIATIFVNPTQFSPSEDFNTYPRDEDCDRARLEELCVDVLFAPNSDEMFPDGHMTEVRLNHFNSMFEGLARPGHFNGVATVVAKLLIQAQADFAFFGEKDFQQLQIITQMAKDLCIPTVIHGVPTVRNKDGLALSSRNIYLDVDEASRAPVLYEALKVVVKGFRAGELAVDLERHARETLAKAGFGAVDYLAVVDAVTLDPVKAYNPKHPARVLAAVRMGHTRLIDNVAVEAG